MPMATILALKPMCCLRLSITPAELFHLLLAQVSSPRWV
jgi:hypothetical protein